MTHPHYPVLRHLLVTNDFPPKSGGIQTYLWELWRRLDTSSFQVLTTRYPGAEIFDKSSAMSIQRTSASMLLPSISLLHKIQSEAGKFNAEMVVLDPVLPLGLSGPFLKIPYAVVLHGAEAVLPARLAGLRSMVEFVLRNASLVIAAGEYVAGTARRLIGTTNVPVIVVPPGVDTNRFKPKESSRFRELAQNGKKVILGLSRLVPRKGMAFLIQAAARLNSSGRDDFIVVIAGTGRSRTGLVELATRLKAPVHFLGQVDDADLSALYTGADIFVMACTNRWWGLEQEGFGIVFLEASACAVPQIAGDSGGSKEAVEDGKTGIVLDNPSDIDELGRALIKLLDNPKLRISMGAAARQRAVNLFEYDKLSLILADGLNDNFC
ncbi:MAG: glycosyltransferase family 4 protein [Actinobacteria bacterium]|nr:glycosyltransferase family 4 protein [Actinomycetota bacterium]MCL6105114.1 glycosyltransferase family 4 protein [Actinomycetota bacterium]